MLFVGCVGRGLGPVPRKQVEPHISTEVILYLDAEKGKKKEAALKGGPWREEEGKG